MSEDLVKQLSSYKAQLQQVEVALSTDPENEDLRKLQKDLQVSLFAYFLTAELQSVNRKVWFIYTIIVRPVQQRFIYDLF